MDDSAIVELFWKRDEQAIAATTEKYNVYCFSNFSKSVFRDYNGRDVRGIPKHT